MKLNAKQLRKLTANSLQTTDKKQEIYIVLDNVLDTYNIGSIFRLADAVAAKKIYICGESEVPPNHRIKKASINTMEIVDWEYCQTAEKVIKDLRLKIKDIQIVAIEQAAGSTSYDKFEYKLPVCLIVGHESDGVSQEVLKICDGIVELPMFGLNKSLNVMVSLGIVLYSVVDRFK